MHHNIARLGITNVALASILLSTSSAFATIAASGMHFVQTEDVDDLDFDQTKAQLTEAKRMISQTIEDLQNADSDIVSTLDFKLVVNELSSAGLISDLPGELFASYNDQGVISMFENLDKMLDRAMADISIISSLSPVVPADTMTAFELGQTYHSQYLALWNVNMVVTDAARRIEHESSLPAMLIESNQKLEATG